VSDKQEAPRKAAAEEDVVELPGESAPSASASQLSLEEQIAQLSDLEFADDIPEDDKKKGSSSAGG